jgi:zinc transporter 1/2/3
MASLWLSSLIFKSMLALAIFALTLVAGLWPFLRRKKMWAFSPAESFASGVFLGAGLLHMLPDSSTDFAEAGYSYPYPYLIAGMIFLVLLVMEQYASSIQRTEKTSRAFSQQFVLLSALMLSIHSFLEGTALGVSLEISTILIIFIAIIAHKGAASFALSTQLNKSLLPFNIRIATFALFSLMTPIGILLGSWVAVPETSPFSLLAPIFNSMAAGTFLYIGTLHGLEQSQLIKHCREPRHIFAMISGFAVMAVVAVWA